MKRITGPASTEKRAYKVKSAVIKGYEYTKSYYKMVDGQPVRCEEGDDSALTIVSIRKAGQERGSKSFIFSEGYIGAEKAYKDDSTKRKSIARKDGFGVSYLIKYIEENEKQGIDNFHVMFLSNKETSENQATLFAKAIKDVSGEGIDTTYMWCHSKSGLLALRAFEKLKEAGDSTVLSKVKAVITSMPAKGTDSVDRNAMADKIRKNKVLSVLPFGGFIKTGALAFYDSFLYRPTPAQVDLKKQNTQALVPVEKSKLRKFFDKVWGNSAFEKRVVEKEKQVPYDPGYLGRTVGDESLATIEDVNYKVLPVNIELQDALKALVKHAQIMPFILYAKKAMTKQKGDGIITRDEQGIDDIHAKFKKSIEVKAGHDIPTSPEALKTIRDELLSKDEGQER